jgi:hypothetical protein
MHPGLFFLILLLILIINGRLATWAEFGQPDLGTPRPHHSTPVKLEAEKPQLLCSSCVRKPTVEGAYVRCRVQVGLVPIEDLRRQGCSQYSARPDEFGQISDPHRTRYKRGREWRPHGWVK